MEEVRIGEEVIVSKDLDEMRENGGGSPDSWYKGPEVGSCSLCLENSKQASVVKEKEWQSGER